MATVRAHLKNSKRNGVMREDEVSILIKYTESRQNRFEIRIGEKVSPEDWDGGEVKSKHPYHARINRKISAEKARLLDLRDKNEGLPFPDFKALAQGKVEKKSTVALAFDGFMKHQGRKRSVKTVAVYNSFKKVIEPYLNRPFQQLGWLFFDEFEASMEHLGNNTRHSYLSHLKCFLNWCFKRGHPVNPAFKEWKITPRYRAPLPLTHEELRRLSDVMLTGKTAQARDLFCFEAYTGQRISDIEAFDEKNLVGTEWTFNRRKGDSIKVKEVTVDLVGYCSPGHAILTKYNLVLPKMSRPTLGKYIRLACEKTKIDTPVTIETKEGNVTVPKWKLVTSHTARKSAITNLLQFFTTDEVMQMVGIDAYATMKHYIGPLDRNLRRKRLVEMENALKEMAQEKKQEETLKVV